MLAHLWCGQAAARRVQGTPRLGSRPSLFASSARESVEQIFRQESATQDSANRENMRSCAAANMPRAASRAQPGFRPSPFASSLESLWSKASGQESATQDNNVSQETILPCLVPVKHRIAQAAADHPGPISAQLPWLVGLHHAGPCRPKSSY